MQNAYFSVFPSFIIISIFRFNEYPFDNAYDTNAIKEKAKLKSWSFIWKWITCLKAILTDNLLVIFPIGSFAQFTVSSEENIPIEKIVPSFLVIFVWLINILPL